MGVAKLREVREKHAAGMCSLLVYRCLSKGVVSFP